MTWTVRPRRLRDELRNLSHDGHERSHRHRFRRNWLLGRRVVRHLCKRGKFHFVVIPDGPYVDTLDKGAKTSIDSSRSARMSSTRAALRDERALPSDVGPIAPHSSTPQVQRRPVGPEADSGRQLSVSGNGGRRFLRDRPFYPCQSWDANLRTQRPTTCRSPHRFSRGARAPL